MKKMKKFWAGLLAVMMLLTVLPAYAVSYSHVNEGVWYSDAVNYVTENDLMDPISGNRFAPDAEATRANLAVALYRAAGSPQVGSHSFNDIPSGSSYANAAAWAQANGVIAGTGNGAFSGDAPITREQIVTILWRYAGSPTPGNSQDFTDESSISSYAVQAVDWSRENGVVSGYTDGRFAPQAHTTRAQLAVILRGYLTRNQPSAPNQPGSGSKVLVAYFSATGSTESVAQTIADTLNGDLFEITPKIPYTSADLNWTDSSSRVNDEHNDPALRNIELVASTVDNWDSYDTVFIGYPIWWGIAAWPTDSFVKANNFAGKTVSPFCTSSSSGLGQSGELLAELANSGNWLTGQRFRSSASRSEVQSWVNSLNISSSEPNEPVKAGRSLVVYFSMPETTNPNNMTTEEDNSVVVINGQVLGNTQYMAQVIQRTVNGDIFRIEPVNPYPTDHRTLVDLASEEQDANARPAIKESIRNLNDYDTIFIGYPIWWSDMPMILYSFFDQYDFSGKTIIPFSTHGGSSFAGTPSTIQRLEPNAKMLDGLTISRNRIQDAEQEIVNWVNGLNIQ